MAKKTYNYLSHFDQRIHQTYEDCVNHTNAAYVEKIGDLAKRISAVCHLDCQPSVIQFIETYIDEFVALSEIKDEATAHYNDIVRDTKPKETKIEASYLLQNMRWCTTRGL